MQVSAAKSESAPRLETLIARHYRNDETIVPELK